MGMTMCRDIILTDERYTYHAGNYAINLTSLAICFIGNYDTQEPSSQSLEAARHLIVDLKNKYPIENIYLHRDLFQTICPGHNITLDKIMEGKVDKERIRKAILSINRREPDEFDYAKYQNYVSIEDLWYDLAESKEHLDMLQKQEYEEAPKLYIKKKK
jgi:hypothetical protein